MVQFSLVRQFNLNAYCFEGIEFPLFGALAASQDDIYYQDKDSQDLQLLNDHLEVIDIDDPDKYKLELRAQYNTLMAISAAI